jgi:hypothetical protein
MYNIRTKMTTINCQILSMADIDAYYDRYLKIDPTKTANETLKELTDMIAKENPDLKMLPHNYCDFVAQVPTPSIDNNM